MSNNQIGQRMRAFGKTKYGKMKDFAGALEITPQALQQYLSGRANPGGIIQAKLRALGADVVFILLGRQEKTEAEKIVDLVEAKFGTRKADALAVLLDELPIVKTILSIFLTREGLDLTKLQKSGLTKTRIQQLLTQSSADIGVYELLKIANAFGIDAADFYSNYERFAMNAQLTGRVNSSFLRQNETAVT